jgi:glycosyltransferase involved in cell wall biosynthesis
VKISVIIPAYNEEKYIGQCLKSLKKQTIAPDEVIVIDNNSTDNTASIAREYGARTVKEPKQGMIYARNAGFDAARFPLIARADADAIAPPDWIEKIKSHFANNGGALTGPIIFYDLPLKSTLYSRAYLKLMSQTLIGPNMAIDKQLWNKVRNEVCLDDSNVHEDVDLSIHIQKAGEKIAQDNSLIVRTSARRIKSNPLSFLLEYPLRLYKTLNSHNIQRLSHIISNNKNKK